MPPISLLHACTAVLVASLAGASATAAQKPSTRDTVSINFGWRFSPDPDGPAHGGDAHGPAVNSTAPAVDAKQAQADFDDSSWTVIDIPHDASVTGGYASSENGGEGFLPLARSWYRKTIVAPESWKTEAVTLVVDAALSTTTWYFNGKQLLVQNPVGYLPTILELDVKAGAENILACYVDGGLTTGWWYEGSGLIRSARLVVTSSAAAVAPFGISSPSFVDGTITPNGPKTSDGLQAATVVMSPTVTVVGAHAEKASVQFTIIDTEGKLIATANDSGQEDSMEEETPSTVVKSTVLHLNNTQLWSVARPYMYLLRVDVAIGGAIFDSTTQSVGVRNLAWDAEQGLKVNEQRVKMRGACNHESFTGVGAALPDRVDLLRVQQMRGVGMNAWRTSHNPPEPVLLELTDRLGVLVLDENRVLATDVNCQGSGCKNVPAYDGDPAADMGSLAKRDRNHPSVAWYSLCNEAGCGNGTLLAGDLVERAKEASYSNDGSRNVGANMGWISPVAPRTPMSDALDVMGMSHASSSSVQAFHEMEPDKPLAMTECCSCQNQRGEDADQPHNKTRVHYTSEVAGCLEKQTSTSDDPEYVAGTFVWSE
jgi:beta-galactosidase/beta-glucuronidase